MRRNWPDLLIGLALVAVIAGIVATLLTGGSFFPRGDDSGGALVSSPPPVGAPVDPDASADDPATPPTVGGLAGSQDPPSVAVPSSPDEASTGLAARDPGPPGAPDPAVEEGAASDADPAEANAAAAAAAAEAADADAPAAAGNVQPLAPGDPEPTPAAAADAASPPSTTTESPFPASTSEEADAGEVPTDPYRVSVGAFGSAANAERQAATFREAGYPVFVGQQDDLSIVLVGPYAEEAEAERVADEIRAGDFAIEPVIYRYEPDEIEELQTSASASDAAATEEDAEPAATEARPSSASSTPEASPTAPAAAGAARRLQVGAYANVESARPQIERLESLGLTARPVEESGLVKLLVGPLEGEELEDAQVVLDGAGVEYFARP